VPPLPVISGQQARRAFERLGWRCLRRKGSHMMLVKGGTRVNLAIPDHGELDRGTLRTLLRRVEVTMAEFVDALQSL
jgi:predicted RNA binding protein YcfA (HicA-like mRNA interferase family)